MRQPVSAATFTTILPKCQRRLETDPLGAGEN
jgi:hypothetical protein